MGTKKMILTAAATLLLAGGLAAFFGGTKLLNGLSDDDVYVKKGAIAYGDGPRRVLDVYLPAGAAPGALSPVIVFFYGGGWRDGSKDEYEFVASSLTREGYVVVIPDYRLYPAVRFPAFIEDAAEAVAWVQREIGAYGGDEAAIFVSGHSAGAHLAAMVALAPEFMEAAEGSAASLRGFVGLSGPYDFLPLDEGSYLQDLFPAESREASQPVYYLKRGGSEAEVAPPLPMLLVHGTDDERVWPRNSRRLAAAARKLGGEVTLRLYEGVGHKRVAASLAPLLEFTADTRSDILTWLRGHQAASQD